MKFSLGASVGPLRVSQSLGVPRIEGPRDACTITHRTVEAEQRCRKKHPTPASTSSRGVRIAGALFLFGVGFGLWYIPAIGPLLVVLFVLMGIGMLLS